MRKSFKRNTDREDKRRKRNLLLVGIFIVVLMVTSMFAFIFNIGGGTTTSTVDYDKTFRVVNQEGVSLWQTSFNGERREFFALPSDVAGYYTPALSELLAEDAFTASFDSFDLDQQSIGFYISQLSDIDRQIGLAFTSPLFNVTGVPILNCANATETVPILEIGLTNDTLEEGLLVDGNCYTLQTFSPQDIVFYIEKMRYAHYGVEFNELG